MTLFSKFKKTAAPNDGLHPDSAADGDGLSRKSSQSSYRSESSAPPPYEDATNGESSTGAVSATIFTPTTQLQIQAIGYDQNTALGCGTLENIPVYRADSGASQLEYTSFRTKRSSNSCALVRGDDFSATPLTATIYRFGPGRPPRIRILPADTTATVESAIESDDTVCELVEVKSRNMFSRAQKMDTSFGDFEWRYGSKAERKACAADSLLILERKTEQGSVRVAQMVRNGEFRTPGTTRRMGGNGGRLMIDLSQWTDVKRPGATDVEAFVVAGCICMLKREADRFRNNQVAAVV